MHRFLLLVLLLAGILACQSQQHQVLTINKEILQLADEELESAVRQYLYFISQVPDSLFPKTLHHEGSLATSKSWWWCSGFYPGTLLYLYAYSGNDSLHREAVKKLALLEKEQYNRGTHDLGFMMYCSYGNALRLSPNKGYEDILVQSARSLSSRYSDVTGCIRSWNPQHEGDYIVIVDNLMNLELLFYATKVTGDSTFYRIAISHADRTMEHHFRPDYSSYHVVDYNPATGKVVEKRTRQGAADSSAWARGQAWGLYGYTMMYRETGEERYLHQANRIADFILNHPRLPDDQIPYWDFDAPDIPHALRDASSAAISASALIELAAYHTGDMANKFLSSAEVMMKSLSGTRYKADQGTNGGFLLKHSVGSLPQDSEVDVPLTYADYYYVEALLRYKTLAEGTVFNF